MPRYDLTLSSKIALLDKIQSQPLNTSYRRLDEITGVPKSTIARKLVLQEGQAGTLQRKREGKDPDIIEALDQWFSIVSGKGEGNERSPTSALNIYSDFVEDKCCKNKRQTTLDTFFALK
ncbi:hypothetical protein RF11_15163 [Thelohanellus kitauei]|uniref:Uncharacterized protein n=1 Tax=Thelohanellus kitauei TaxID=669202 RepID=A0A0C2IJG4_THEKT|nr:hypothetical protein RF11_15163 [Thelohanellus kitauei]